MRPEDYIVEARSWENTPFAHKGRTKGRAVDCIGLVHGAALAIGLIGDELPDYARNPVSDDLQHALKNHPALMEVRTLAPGDILLFKLVKFGQHVGIFTGRNLIHSYQPMNGYVEHRFCDKWRARLLSAYRFRVMT